ncbi:unnamed protein product, partial [Brachionus calyciflorus]
NKEFISILLEENQDGLVVEGVDFLSEQALINVEQRFSEQDEELRKIQKKNLFIKNKKVISNPIDTLEIDVKLLIIDKMATGIHSTNDISSDEFYARKLQKEEEDRAKEEARRKRAALFRKRIRELSSSDQIQVVQNDEDDDIIVIDDDDEDNVNRRQLNSRPRNTSPKKKESPRNEDTNSDELLARRLQEEFDKELATSLSRNEPNPFRRHNSLSQINSSSTDNNNSNFRIPDSIQSDILFNLARERNTRNNNNNPTSINSPFNSNNIMYNSSRSSNSNNNNDPINDLATAFNFIHNQQFMDDFLSDDNQNTRNRNNSNVPNNNRRQTNTRNQTNRIASNLLLGGSSLRGRGRQNPLFGLLANQRDFTADDYDSLLRLDELNGVKKCLNKQEIESLPTFQFRENNETPEENTCSICFEVYTTKDKLTSLACLHKFHKNCIKDWLKESRQCPLCKKDAINGRLNPSRTLLLLCDMQDKFAPHIQYFNQIVDNSGRLVDIAKHLNVPYIATEHYPKGLGPTVPLLKQKCENIKVFEKTLFSMCTKDLVDHINKEMPDYQSVLLCGIEAHACVLSTCLDFLDIGKDVHVIVDAVSSRSLVDRKYAIERMKQSGAFLTTSESIVFQLCKNANHPKFKEIQKLIKHPSHDTGLLKI